jgi:AhpC/TSA family
MRALAIATVVACTSCSAPEPRLAQVPSSIELVEAGGGSLDLRRAAETARLTVLVFFSPHCHCLDEHQPRLRALYAEYQTQHVQFLMIDSEVGSSPERDAEETQRRGYLFPILFDRGGRLAELLGAEYATYTVVLDAEGRIRYHGGIDTDKTHLHDDATPYLRNAIDDLLAGRAPRVASGKALGCALEKW